MLHLLAQDGKVENVEGSYFGLVLLGLTLLVLIAAFIWWLRR